MMKNILILYLNLKTKPLFTMKKFEDNIASGYFLKKAKYIFTQMLNMKLLEIISCTFITILSGHTQFVEKSLKISLKKKKKKRIKLYSYMNTISTQMI